MLLKKDFEGGLRAIFDPRRASIVQDGFKESAPMIQLLRDGGLPPTFSTASTRSGPRPAVGMSRFNRLGHTMRRRLRLPGAMRDFAAIVER
jgi:hypothetical protein